MENQGSPLIWNDRTYLLLVHHLLDLYFGRKVRILFEALAYFLRQRSVLIECNFNVAKLIFRRCNGHVFLFEVEQLVWNGDSSIAGGLFLKMQIRQEEILEWLNHTFFGCLLFLLIAEVALHLFEEDLLEKHVLVGLLCSGLDLFFDDVHQGIVTIFDDDVHAGVVVGALAVFWVGVQGLELSVAADFGEKQDLEDMAEGEGPVEEKLEEKVAQEVNYEL